MKKTQVIRVRVPRKVKETIKQMARVKKQTLSDIVRLILERACN